MVFYITKKIDKLKPKHKSSVQTQKMSIIYKYHEKLAPASRLLGFKKFSSSRLTPTVFDVLK